MAFHPKFLVPNGITVVAVLLGAASIRTAALGDLEFAAWLFLWATLLDNIDGVVARRIGATSRFGTELDSLSDFVSFGVAPAALISFAIDRLPGWEGASAWLVHAACGAYIAAAAIRLARFNVTTPEPGISGFEGVPTTHCAALIGSLFLTLQRHAEPQVVAYAMPLAIVITTYLMVSRLPLPKMRRRKYRAANGLQIACVTATYILAPLRLLPELLFGIALLFLVAGVGIGFADRARDRRDPAPA